MKITGTKSYVQIEDEDGNIARFDGETCLGGFYAYAAPVCWLRHQGEATEADRLALIYKATRYGKDNGVKILFFDADGKVLFETELGLKTEVRRSKTYYAFMAVVVLSLGFSVLLLAILDVEGPMLLVAMGIVAALFAAPFLFYGFLVWRFRVSAEGERITVRPGIGRKYSFRTGEITKILRKTKREASWEEIQNITIYAKSRHVSMNREMEGIEEMDAYLARHVEPEKIITRRKGS